MRVSHVALPAGFHSPQFFFRQASDEISEAAIEQRPRCDRPIVVLHLPKFASGARVITIGCLRTGTEHEWLAGVAHDERSAVGLAQVTVLRHLARNIFIVPYDGPVGFPSRLAGLLVERDVILQIRAIECKDEKILKQNRRGRWSTVMAATQIFALPKNFACG